MSFNCNEIKNFPTDPGVYIMKDVNKNIIYIGKAKNIKTRIKQYFSQSKDNRIQVPYLISQITSIDTIVTRTEKEALLLENTLIKKHQPKYNILLKDDKTYASLMLTKHSWPMIKLIRSKKISKKEKDRYFGPYTNARAAKKTLDLLLRLFPLRRCSDNELINRTRPCILFGMKRCLAPCVQKCSHEEYQQLVEKAIALLQGKDKQILKNLYKEMKVASQDLEFEKAKYILETIEQIEHVTQIQHVDNVSAYNCDAIGLHHVNDIVIITKLTFQEGKLIGAVHYNFSYIASSDSELLESFLLQNYKKNDYCPTKILIPIDLTNKNDIAEIFSDHFSKKIVITHPKKGEKVHLLEMANKNAKARFSQLQNMTDHNEKLLLELQETLQLTNFPRKIDCFDISNISQTEIVGSMIRFTDGKKDPSHMRLFKIKEDVQGDCPSLQQVLTRYFSKEKNNPCDLLIVDGAKAQLNVAIAVLQKMNIASIDIMAIGKEDARHDKGLTQEKIFIPNTKLPILLPIKSPLLFFLQKIRDEAHRSAIIFHRKLRSKKTTTSILEKIPGIGQKKQKALLTHFKSTKRVQEASIQELEKIKELTKTDIKNIILFFQKKKSK